MTTEVIPCQVMEASIETALKLLATPGHFKKPLEVAFVHGQQHMRDIYRRKGDIEFPIAAVLFDSMSKDRSSYHGLTLQRQGVVGTYDGDKKVFYKWHLRPVVVNLVIRYITNNHADAMSFQNVWMLKDRELNFDLKYDGMDFAIGIRVEINDDLQIPPMENDQAGELITIETSLIIHTYVGEIRSVAPVSERSQFTMVIPFQNDATVEVTNIRFGDGNG